MRSGEGKAILPAEELVEPTSCELVTFRRDHPEAPPGESPKEVLEKRLAGTVDHFLWRSLTASGGCKTLQIYEVLNVPVGSIEFSSSTGIEKCVAQRTEGWLRLWQCGSILMHSASLEEARSLVPQEFNYIDGFAARL